MLTLTCTLVFPDGAVASGSVSVHSPENEGLVSYSGESIRIAQKVEQSDAAFLEFIFKKTAEATGARLTVTREGVYDLISELRRL